MENARLQVKGVLLDLDGTVVDSRQAYLEAARRAFMAVGQTIVDIRVVTEIPKRFEQGIPIDDLIPGTDVTKFGETYLKAYYQATSTKVKPIPNVADTLRKISEKAKIALTTRRHVPKEEVIAELQKFDLAKYFQVVLTAMDTLNPKPSPEALLACSKALGIEVCACAVVGDSVVDIRAGKNAGAKTVAVLSGIFSREELKKEKPDLILESVNQLPDFLE